MSVALVTGAARGIGAATVRTLAADGWSVLAVDIAADDPALPYALATPVELEAVAAAAGPRVRAYVADVRDEAALAAGVATAVAEWGGLDAAIACAGVIAGGVAAWKLPPDEQRAVLDVNLGGVIAL